MLDRLRELEKLNKTLHQLRSKEKDLSKPTLTDLSKLNDVKTIVKEQCQNTDFSWRDYFVVVSLYLFQPKALLGQKLINGMRVELTKQLDVSDIHISRSISKNIAYLNTYKGFRKACEAIVVVALDKIGYN